MNNPLHYLGAGNRNVDVSGVSSLVELLQLRAQRQPQHTAYVFLADGGQQELTLSYGELDRQARSIAARLQALGMQGERALLLYAPGLDYIAAFFGCLYAGVIAVPAYPPRNGRHLPRLQAILADSQAVIILSTATIAASPAVLSAQQQDYLKQRWLLTGALADNAGAWQAPCLQKDQLAFLQYTSGSTGNAKGVMVSHGNLMANQQMIKAGFGHDSASTVVGWLPLYHDMGLIGNVMQPLYIGAPAILMAPMAFLERPLRWLQAISKYRAHTSGGPNFAYDLCVRKIGKEDKAALDLSSWQLAFNGSEPVQAATLERFAQAFAACGFRREAFYPCYGLAEATLLVSGAAKSDAPTVKAFNQSRLQESIACSKPAPGGAYRRLVGCGGSLAEHAIRISHPETGADCASGHIGEIQVSGPSVARGYWQNAEATAATFAADDNGIAWLRTGDLGFFDNGELFVSGRIKDLIIVRGRNYHPHDIEAAAEASVNCLNTGCSAAFALPGEDGEQLVLLAELTRGRLKQSDFRCELAAIRARLSDECGIQPDVIALLKPGAVLKTTSGKIRRSACREAFVNNILDAVVVDDLRQPHILSAAENYRPTAAAAPSPVEQQLLRQALLSLPSADGAPLLAQYLCARIAALSGLAPERIDSADAVLSQGIDSLKAVELKYALDDLLYIDLPLVCLLEDRSVSAVAEYALDRAKQPRQPFAADAAAGRHGLEQPLSLGQQAIWTVCRFEPQSPVYNMPAALRIRSAVDGEALQSALRLLVQRHEQLRTVFRLNGNKEPVQILLPEAESLLQRVECRDDAARDRDIAAEIRRPFDLENGPLLRTVLFSTAGDDHILLFCAHHIAVDFRSMAVLLDELQHSYAVQTAVRTASLPPLTASYRDYVGRQQRYLSSVQAEGDLRYWQEQLGGELPKLELPADRPRAPASDCRGGSEILTIDAQTARALRALAERYNVTLYTLLLCVFKVLLHRYSGQQDIIVGSPTLGRPAREFAGLVGYFVNPVALRSRPSGDKTFSGYLAEVRQTVVGALAHQDYPFALLVEKIQPEREQGAWPFYRVMFVLQDGAAAGGKAASLALGVAGTASAWPGLEAESATLRESIAQFDLTLMMAETGNGLSAAFQYRSALWERSTILHMLGHFQCLLRGVLAAPAMRLTDLPLLTLAERKRQLLEWNPGPSFYPQDLCIHQWFERQAEKTPAAAAAVFQDQHISYAQLNAAANRLAHYLRERGAGPETRIALCLERSLEMLVGLLAVLKAGAAYVPIDPDYPLQRRQYLLEDAGCRLLLTSSGLAGSIASANVEIVCLDGTCPASAHCYAENPYPLAVPDNTAYLIYTSGSTGRPKGVMVSHRNVVHSTWARFQYYPEPVGCYLLLSSFAFDSSVAGIFWTLSRGGCLCLPDDRQPKDPAAIGALIERRQVTHVLALPSLYAILLEQVPVPRLASLQTVIVAGESCSASIVKQHYACLPQVRLYNEYGPTEATVWSSAHAVDKPKDDAAVAIGKPVSNMQIYILDRYLQPQPAGAVGEVYIGGAGITRGYLKRPDLSAEKFVPNPFGEAGSRLYKSGDLARYRGDGLLEFCGRSDAQVKLRGYRIELGEIEARLLQHSAVKEAAVLIREDQPGNRRLVAYLVLRQGDALDAAAMKTWLKDSLPDYMLPSACVILEGLPLNANGKLDRHALPAPEAQRAMQRPAVAPRDAAEEAVAGIWSDVLGIHELSIHDDFFELGGHSLSGVQIMLRLQELFAMELPVKMLFEAPTIAQLVDRVADYQANEC